MLNHLLTTRLLCRGRARSLRLGRTLEGRPSRRDSGFEECQGIIVLYRTGTLNSARFRAALFANGYPGIRIAEITRGAGSLS